MNITAKQINLSNIVGMWKDGNARLPDPQDIFSSYSAEESKGSLFSDNVATATRIFELPARGIQWVFEPARTRLEDKQHRAPADSKLAQEFARVLAKLYSSNAPVAYGFNYDVIYRLDSVIPIKDIMGHFLRTDAVENISNFGWQYSLAKEKGKRVETYFFKAVSPIEYAVHSNVHLNKDWPKAADLQAQFEKEYGGMDESVSQIAFN